MESAAAESSDSAGAAATSGQPEQARSAAGTDPETKGPATADPESTDGPGTAEPAADGQGTAEPGATDGPETTGTEAAGAAPTRHSRFRVPFRRARRLPSPRQVAVRSTQAVRAWSRRPSGRLALPGLLLLLLVAGAATAGAVLVPSAAPAPRGSATASADPTQTAPPPPIGPDQGLAPATPPVRGPTAVLPPPGAIGGRPADVLAGWAQQTGARVEIPPVAMQAYGYAELVLAQTKPSCQLTWTTLAAIGLVESNHGSANDAVLGPDGQAVPNIIGLPLDGKGGRQRIGDTDGGQLDGDTTYDRAVGPMQFIPSTWREDGVDADNDGVKNPHDIDDAALAAGNYLCANGRNLATAEDWWNAILSYNDVRPYAQAVFDAANRYGTGSRA